MDIKSKDMFCNFIDREFFFSSWFYLWENNAENMSKIFKPKHLFSFFKFTFYFFCSTVLIYQLIDITNKYLEFSHEVKLKSRIHVKPLCVGKGPFTLWWDGEYSDTSSTKILDLSYFRSRRKTNFFLTFLTLRLWGKN